MATAQKIENYDLVLAVEGYSDLSFYAEMLEAVGKHGTVFIKHFNGKEDLAAKLETFVTPQLLATKKSIGIIVDGNGNPGQAIASFTQLISRLTGQSIQCGQWTSGVPKVGLFVTPDGSSSGEVETLVWRAWSADPKNAQTKQCIETYVSCMKSAGFSAKSPDKGLISSLLAIRNDEDPRLGPGARANVFDFSRPEFDSLKSFLAQI